MQTFLIVLILIAVLIMWSAFGKMIVVQQELKTMVQDLIDDLTIQGVIEMKNPEKKTGFKERLDKALEVQKDLHQKKQYDA